MYTRFQFLALLILIWTGNSCHEDQYRVELTFAFSPEDSKTIQPLINQFNEQQSGIWVHWKQCSRASNEFYQELVRDLQADSSQIDVFGADVVWTAALANDELVMELTDDFYRKFEAIQFVQAALNSATYQSTVYGVPWFTDAGVLYYRKDLLEQLDTSTVPTTWPEIFATAKQIMQQHQLPYGYIFEGAAYEGGTVNACEFIWNTGGTIMTGHFNSTGVQDNKQLPTTSISIQPEACEKGFQAAIDLINQGISPATIHSFRTLEAANAFREGKAAFLRSWPGVYGSFSGSKSRVRTHQIGVTALPVAHATLPAYSCLGGWNLMINKKVSATKKEAAWQFISFLVAEKQQKYRALQGGYLPSLTKLYSDQELIDQVATIAIAKDLISQARSRPRTPYYKEFSAQLAYTFNQVLQGKLSPTAATTQLQGSMKKVLEKQKEGVVIAE